MKPYFFALFLVAGSILIGCESPTEPLQATSSEEESLQETSAAKASPLPQQELARLRAAVAKYHDIDQALADGYTVEFTGYRSQMGFHYLNPDLVDDRFEVERPEVVMYAPAPNGGLRFVGVEYAQPIDLQNPPPAPEGFSGDADVWTLNTEFSVWALHAWVGLQNPNGIFSPHNPRLP